MLDKESSRNQHTKWRMILSSILSAPLSVPHLLQQEQMGGTEGALARFVTNLLPVAPGEDVFLKSLVDKT